MRMLRLLVVRDIRECRWPFFLKKTPRKRVCPKTIGWHCPREKGVAWRRDRDGSTIHADAPEKGSRTNKRARQRESLGSCRWMVTPRAHRNGRGRRLGRPARPNSHAPRRTPHPFFLSTAKPKPHASRYSRKSSFHPEKGISIERQKKNTKIKRIN